jgi:hypothetical protein
MRKGGGQHKGAAFERKVGQQLSLWLTEGARADLFSRNVLSGGRFTLAVKNGVETSTPGDLMAAHPLAFEFLSRFMVECKHYKDLQILQFLLDRRNGTSFLSKVIDKAGREAKHSGLIPMVIAQQNQLTSPLVFLPMSAGVHVLSARQPTGVVVYHKLHRDTVLVLRLDALCMYIRAKDLLTLVGARL